MRLHEEPSSGSDTQAPEIRVPTVEFTRALAEIGARKARQAFDQAGTLTLAEALQETDVEATVEELAEEVTKVREADAVEAGKQKRRHRLRLILLAELASILLCGLTLLSLSRTVYNPQWQASHQRDEMKNNLRLTQGPNPKYDIFVDIPTSRHMTASKTYPLSILPDGYNIRHQNGLDEDGHYSIGSAVPVVTSPAYFEFHEAQPSSVYSGAVSVFYEGRLYQRGWISKADIKHALGGQNFVYFPEPILDPRISRAGLVPMTVSMQSMEEANPQWSFWNWTTYGVYTFPEGNKVELDEHAWEPF